MFGSYSASVPWVITDSANLSYWQNQSLDANTTVVEDVAGNLGYSRLQIVFDRTTPVGTREDVMVSGMSWAQAAAAVATPLSVGDKVVVETALAAWWLNVKAMLSNQYTLREYRWYDYQPITSRPGPVDRVTPIASAGTAASARLADQLSFDQTFKTCSRKHWGRIYLPFPGASFVDTTYGRATNTCVTNLNGYMRTLLQTSGGSGLINPVVASNQYHGVMGIKELQSDNVIDVIRRRRAKVATFYQRFTS